jgi:hypothetical protein
MIRCPYCGHVLDYCETKMVDEKARKFYNLYLCTNDNCITNHEIITDCTGELELGYAGCCYPEELRSLEA